MIKYLNKMGLPFVERYCINCAVSTSSENQLFSKFTIVDEIYSLKSLERDVAILDAILCIYGFSATNLASVYMDEPKEVESFPCTTVSETSDYIIEHGLFLCSNCVSVFKQVYIAVHRLKKLSTDEALLKKAIKKFSPSFIKIEVDTDESRCGTENSESEDVIRSDNPVSNSINFSDAHFLSEADGNEADDLFESFNFEKDNDNDKYCNNDIKSDANNERKSVATPSTTLLMNRPDDNSISPPVSEAIIKKLNKIQGSSSENLSVRRRGRPRKADAKSPRLGNFSDSCVALSCDKVPGQSAASLLNNDDKISDSSLVDSKHEGLPTLTVKLVRLEEQNDTKRELITENISPDIEKRRPRNEALWRRNATKKSKALGECYILHNSMNIRPPRRVQDINCRHNCKVKLSEEEKLEVFNRFNLLANHEAQNVYLRRSIGTNASQKNCNLHIGNRTESVCRLYFLGLHGINRSRLRRKVLNRTVSIEDLRGKHGNHRKGPKHFGPFICEVCGKSFDRWGHLIKHSLVHSNEERLKCTECGRSLKNIKSLRNHMKIKHRTEKSILCHLCGKTTKTMSNMKSHMIHIHDPNRSLKTSLPKITKESSDLGLH